MRNDLLQAADGLTLDLSGDCCRVAWREPDWLGPLGVRFHCGSDPLARPQQVGHGRSDSFRGSDDLGEFTGIDIRWEPTPIAVRTTVRAYRARSVLVFRIQAAAPIVGLANGDLSEPSVAWPAFDPAKRLADGVPADTRSFGYQYTEFALPTSSDASCAGFRLAPHRPAIVEPLLFIAPDGRTLLLAPLNAFHAQVIAIPADVEQAGRGVRCGWHGDLESVSAGFATELAIWAAASPRQALDQWGAYLQSAHRTRRPSRYADPGVARLSYWTDNGAVYYYRTERECDYSDTLANVVTDLRRQQVPIASLQLDSWFYPHENLRPVSDEGAPVVPPSGLMLWEPRADLFPEGFSALREGIGDLPLILHSRHFSSRSPYFDQHPAWRDGECAHPSDDSLFDRLLEQAAAWGAITYEQDWLVEAFLRVRGLREEPDRARAWQESLDRAAAENGLTLQWCMGSPADFMQTVTLSRVTSIRTSGDYRYLFDNGFNWNWFLCTNALARALGLNSYKDVFLSHGATEQSSGERYAEVEALLAALSAGPVGIGDQRGCTERGLVMRTCRADGILIKPDVPIAAIDRCLRTNAFLNPELLIGETFSRHPADAWVYVACFNVHHAKNALTGEVALADLGSVRPVGPVLVFDWRRRTWTRLEVDGAWSLGLEFQEWDFRVVCPLLPGGVTVFGDVTKYATVGDRRVANICSDGKELRFYVRGAPGEAVAIDGWAEKQPGGVSIWSAGERRSLPHTPQTSLSPLSKGGTQGGSSTPEHSWSWNPDDGRWVVRVAIGPTGQVDVSLAI